MAAPSHTKNVIIGTGPEWFVGRTVAGSRESFTPFFIAVSKTLLHATRCGAARVILQVKMCCFVMSNNEQSTCTTTPMIISISNI
jgi:hypothetical protein